MEGSNTGSPASTRTTGRTPTALRSARATTERGSTTDRDRATPARAGPSEPTSCTSHRRSHSSIGRQPRPTAAGRLPGSAGGGACLVGEGAARRSDPRGVEVAAHWRIDVVRRPPLGHLGGVAGRRPAGLRAGSPGQEGLVLGPREERHLVGRPTGNTFSRPSATAIVAAARHCSSSSAAAAPDRCSAIRHAARTRSCVGAVRVTPTNHCSASWTSSAAAPSRASASRTERTTNERSPSSAPSSSAAATSGCCGAVISASISRVSNTSSSMSRTVEQPPDSPARVPRRRWGSAPSDGRGSGHVPRKRPARGVAVGPGAYCGPP